MPYELPEYDDEAFRRAQVGLSIKRAVIPEDAYDRMLMHYSDVGPKKFKFQLKGLDGAIRTVRFHKDLYFHYKEGGNMVLLNFISDRLEAAFGPMLNREEQQRIREANYTGNHYRNHHVRVPTAPGQPVRG